jgi:hypothetical protein
MAVSKAEVEAAKALNYIMYKEHCEQKLDKSLKEGVRYFACPYGLTPTDWDALVDKYRCVGWTVVKTRTNYLFS